MGFILFSSGSCAIVSMHTTSSACHHTRSSNAGLDLTISGLCKITLCNFNKSRLFILTDVSLRRLETEKRYVQHTPKMVSILSDIFILPHNQIMKD